MEHRTSIPQLWTEMKLSESEETPDPETIRVEPAEPSDSETIRDDAAEPLVAEDNVLPNEKIILEPVEQNPYEMSYTCLLLSRFDSYSLTGEVAIDLQTCLQQICTSFGWNLEILNIEPTYLHWTIRVPPATSTSQIMKVVREQTSIKILGDFPGLKHENQSDDFWAPGYLIFWGSQPHPIEIIQRFIRQTRQQQGL